MQVLLFQTHVDDKKHGLEFDKDRISYRKKTFDAVLSKEFKAILVKTMLEKGLKYPIALTLNDDDYFMKPKKYKTSDGKDAIKNRCVITNAHAIEQGKFESKSLDDIVDEYEQEAELSEAAKIYGEALGDGEDDAWIKALEIVGKYGD